MSENQISMFDVEQTTLNRSNMENPALLRDIPFEKIYEAARKEASRKKPVFFIHKYFARRITLNFRLMLLGLLLPSEANIEDYLYQSFTDQNLQNFVVLDPFMGGGTTLFEATRLKTKVIGCDLQPLSKFVSKALLEHIEIDNVEQEKIKLENKVKNSIMRYYKTCCSNCGEEADVMYTFHVKKVIINNKTHKLFSNFVIAQKNGIFTLICPACGEVYEHDFKKNGSAICPSCLHKIDNPKDGYVKQGKYYSDEFPEGKLLSSLSEKHGYPHSTDIIAVEYYCPHCKAHEYKKADRADIDLYESACAVYEKVKNTLPIPEQEIPNGYNTNQIINHGYKKFNELFNKRQLLGLGILLKSINEIEDKSVSFWMQLAFSGMLEMNNMFCRYQANASKISNLFFNHAYVPITMPVENNIWGTKLGTGNFDKTIDKIIRGKKFCTNMYDISTIRKNGKFDTLKIYSNEKVSEKVVDNYNDLKVGSPLLLCKDSSKLDELPNNTVDVVLTDPPFGANVMYSELIDFFHVWNTKSNLAKDLGFSMDLSPKEEEIIVNEVRNKNQESYENGLIGVFTEMHRVLKDDGYLIFSFHDKSLNSWLSMFNSIYKSGFYVAQTYPVHAESRTGAHTSNKNSIVFDIMIICRKYKNTEKGIYVQSKEDILENSFKITENFVSRLKSVDAEVTIPDIENIFISQFLCQIEKYNIDYLSNYVDIANDIAKAMVKIDRYFENYEISKKRNGWWSELYKDMWSL